MLSGPECSADVGAGDIVTYKQQRLAGFFASAAVVEI